MSVLVQNQGSHVEYVAVVNAITGEPDTVTVQPGGRVTLPRGYRVAATGVNLPHLHVVGNDTPVSPLQFKE
jgi:hypothetical protein